VLFRRGMVVGLCPINLAVADVAPQPLRHNQIMAGAL
jgi:hypothetical protein